MQIYYTIINRIIQLKSRDRERMANGEWQIVNDDEKKYCQLACLNAILLHGPPPPHTSHIGGIAMKNSSKFSAVST